MLINFNEVKNLIKTGNLSEVSRQTGIPYRTLQAYKLGENKWLEDTEGKLIKLQNYIANKEELKMRKELTVKNLYFSHYDNGLHTLEFDVNGTKVFVNNIDVDVAGDEFYWDDEENVKNAVDAADDDDIEIIESEEEEAMETTQYGEDLNFDDKGVEYKIEVSHGEEWKSTVYEFKSLEENAIENAKRIMKMDIFNPLWRLVDSDGNIIFENK